MTVTAVYSDESTKDVTAEAVLSGYDKDAEGTQEITVTYTEGDAEATATFNVTVKADETDEHIAQLRLDAIVADPKKLVKGAALERRLAQLLRH